MNFIVVKDGIEMGSVNCILRAHTWANNLSQLAWNVKVIDRTTGCCVYEITQS